MATFNPLQQDARPEDYLKLSQGYRDSTVGELFKDLGDTLNVGVKAVDQTFKQLVRDDARAITDEVQNATIDELQMHAGVGTPRMRADRTPDEIARFTEKARRFQSGLNAGNIKESSYWAMLDTGARQLRSRYPGYRDTIDDALKEFTGGVPANQLIRELRQDAEQLMARQKDPQNAWAKQVEEMAKDGSVGGAMIQEIVKDPTKYTLPALLSIQADHHRQKAVVAAQTAAYGLASQEGTANKTAAVEVARGQFGLEFGKFVGDKTSLFGKSEAERRAIQDRIKGRDPTPEEARQVQQLMFTQRQELNDFWTRFTTQTKINGQTFTQIIPGADLKALKDQVDETVTTMEKSLTDPQSGFLGLASRQLKLLQDQSEARALGTKETQLYYGIRKTLGEGPMGVLLSSGDKASPLSIPAMHRALTDLGTSQLMDPKSPTSMHVQAQDIAKKGDEKAMEVFIKQAVGTISDPKLPPETRREMSIKMYGDRNSMFLNLANSDPSTGGSPEAKRKLFGIMANPAVAKELSKASKDLGDPAIFSRYQKWVVDQVYALNQVDVSTVAKAQMDAPGISISFSPENFAFTTIERELPSSSRAGEPGIIGMARSADNAWQRSRVPELDKAVRDLNKALAPLRDIADHHAADRNQFAISVLRTLGTKVISNPQEPTGVDSFLTKMSKYITTTKMYEESAKIREERAARLPTSAENSGRTLLDRFKDLLPSQEETDKGRTPAGMVRK